MSWLRKVFGARGSSDTRKPQQQSRITKAELLETIGLQSGGSWTDDSARMRFVKAVVMSGASALDAGAWCYNPESIPANSKFKIHGLALEYAIACYDGRERALQPVQKKLQDAGIVG